MPRRRAFQKTVQHLNLTNRQRVKWQARYYLARHQARSFKTAYNGIPFPVALAVRAALVMFALLPIMPQHPLSIAVTFGSGLSVAVILSALKI